MSFHVRVENYDIFFHKKQIFSTYRVLGSSRLAKNSFIKQNLPLPHPTTIKTLNSLNTMGIGGTFLTLSHCSLIETLSCRR
jgi:hypothetical protein